MYYVTYGGIDQKTETLFRETLIIVEFARVSRLIERDFSRDGGKRVYGPIPLRRRRTIRVDDRKIRIMLR